MAICMNVDCFLDSNVLVYAATGDEAGADKRKRALALIEREDFGLSAQVLQEFYVVVTRKIERPLSAVQALEWIEEFAAFPCAPIDSSLVKIGIEVSVRFQIPYWDGAIVTAAESMGAEILYSEDLSHGQHYGKVQVINPFAPEGRMR